ncbi:NAD(P)-dependent oxidoreductase [Peribacillus sp. TH14]|uniref:NAD(P)-dependent oxidoreductase n=1 Tax=Peribacillus sp. TH14 TaxID=2798481 RepID=UPI0009E97358|nr:NAD(P)-dependent oxidoreductase [Peribacillus sp. TH14]MBK5502670.1 NAD(P)-dependent oxidoreductase [Peribacillus sp. TH14]
MNAMVNIGFIGIGKMGRLMSENLLNSGYKLSIYDKNSDSMNQLKEKGAIIASSVHEIGKRNDIIFTMLPDSHSVESVLDGEHGLFHSMKQGGMIVDMSSSYVFSTKQLAKRASALRLTLVDAPVSGGIKGAKEGTLTIMVGANQEDFLKALPYLKVMGKVINLVGDTGSGHALKAINNFLSATSLYATSEAMILAKKLGIDLEIALDTINKSSGQSFSTDYKYPSFILPRSFDSGFSLDLLLKDVKMVSSIAKDTKIPVLLAAIVEQIYEAASRTGEENQDHTEVIKFLERISNFSLQEVDELQHNNHT